MTKYIIRKPDDVKEWPEWVSNMDEFDGAIVENPEFRCWRDEEYITHNWEFNKKWLEPIKRYIIRKPAGAITRTPGAEWYGSWWRSNMEHLDGLVISEDRLNKTCGHTDCRKYGDFHLHESWLELIEDDEIEVLDDWWASDVYHNWACIHLGIPKWDGLPKNSKPLNKTIKVCSFHNFIITDPSGKKYKLGKPYGIDSIEKRYLRKLLRTRKAKVTKYPEGSKWNHPYGYGVYTLRTFDKTDSGLGPRPCLVRNGDTTFNYFYDKPISFPLSDEDWKVVSCGTEFTRV